MDRIVEVDMVFIEARFEYVFGPSIRGPLRGVAAQPGELDLVAIVVGPSSIVTLSKELAGMASCSDSTGGPLVASLGEWLDFCVDRGSIVLANASFAASHRSMQFMAVKDLRRNPEVH